MTGDGIDDLFTCSNCCDSTGMFMFPGKGDGTFDNPTYIMVVLDDFSRESYPGKRPLSVFVHDHNADGIDDLCVFTYVSIDGKPRWIMFVGQGPIAAGNTVDLKTEIAARQKLLSAASLENSELKKYLDFSLIYSGPVALPEEILSDPRVVPSNHWPLKGGLDYWPAKYPKAPAFAWKLEATEAIPADLNGRDTFISFAEGDGNKGFVMIAAREYVPKENRYGLIPHPSDIWVYRNTGTLQQPKYGEPTCLFTAPRGMSIQAVGHYRSPQNVEYLVATIEVANDKEREFEVWMFEREGTK